MKNRVTVTIADQEYTLIADQDKETAELIASYVDSKVREVALGSHMSLTDCAILAAMNIAEDYFREQEASENLRRQLKEYLEEGSKVKQELSEAKRELFKLQNKR